MSLRKVVLAVALAAFAAPPVWAQDALKIGLAGDKTDVSPVGRASRLVTFRYSPDVSFAIRAMADTFVNVEVPEGEKIEGFYTSDAVRWSYHVTADGARVLVKPLEAGLVNTGTMVTDKRSYELTLLSVAPGAMWHQRVRWQVPGQAADGGFYVRPKAGEAGRASQLDGAGNIDPKSLNFGYTVKGKAPFVPESVFDDGKRTWIRFGTIQDLPAIFARSGSELEIVEFAVDGAYVVLPSVAKTLVLRLRNHEVTLERRG